MKNLIKYKRLILIGMASGLALIPIMILLTLIFAP